MADNSGTKLTMLLGAACAGVISYAKFHSIFWTLVSALSGWAYVIYYLIRYGVPHV